MKLHIIKHQTLLWNKQRQYWRNRKDRTKKQRKDKSGKVKGDRTYDKRRQDGR